MDKRQIIIEELQKQLLEWNKKIGELESKAAETGSSLKTNYSETIEILHPEIKLVEMRMAELREKGEDVYEELIHGLQKAIKDLKEAYRKASVHSHQEPDRNFA